jgi:hypothetical protein
MAYTSGDTILDNHYNDFATSVNAVWGSGSGDSGYGQTNTVSSVSAGTTITASQWTTLLARISSAASHQSSSITSISSPSAGDTISAYAALSGNISTITTNRLNVRWDLSGHTSDSKANEWNTLASNCGTFYITAQGSGKSGGGGTASTNNTNAGWHDMSGAYVTYFQQFEDTGPYTASNIQLQYYKTGGSVLFRSYWNDAAADQTSYNKNIYNVLDQVDGTKLTYFGHEEPTTTYISDTWGNGPSQTVNANG